MNGCALATMLFAAIARVRGLQPDVKNGVAKITVPRADLVVTVDGVKMQPFQGFIMFLHFWGKGPADDLARGIEAARATQQR